MYVDPRLTTVGPGQIGVDQAGLAAVGDVEPPAHAVHVRRGYLTHEHGDDDPGAAPAELLKCCFDYLGTHSHTSIVATFADGIAEAWTAAFIQRMNPGRIAGGCPLSAYDVLGDK